MMEDLLTAYQHRCHCFGATRHAGFPHNFETLSCNGFYSLSNVSVIVFTHRTRDKAGDMNTYRTGEIASLVGLHPNTIRLYEQIGFLTKPERLPNGYRIYTEMHLEQVRCARLALRAEVLQNGLRKRAVEIIRLSAAQEFDAAQRQTQAYIEQIDREILLAQGAIRSVENMICHQLPPAAPPRRRSEAAGVLGITIDTLRNWERNGLASIRRMPNGYHVYEAADIQRLLIIRTLRCANYSLSAILRLTGRLASAETLCVADALNRPAENEEIVSVCDHLLGALSGAREDAVDLFASIARMKQLHRSKELHSALSRSE